MNKLHAIILFSLITDKIRSSMQFDLATISKTLLMQISKHGSFTSAVFNYLIYKVENLSICLNYVYLQILCKYIIERKNVL
jgi:hypothetical protein